MTKGQLIYLGIVGAGALISLMFPAAVFFGLVLGVMPGVFLIASLPLFYYGVLAVTVRNQVFMLPALWRWGLIAASLAVLAIGPAVVMNYLTSRQIAELQGGDRTLDDSLPAIKTLAYISPQQNSSGPECEAICQKLLFNGSAQALILGESQSGRGAEFAEKLVEYRIERRPTCPAVKLPTASSRVPPISENEARILAEHVLTRMASGDCLVSEPASIAKADVIVLDNRVKIGRSKTRQSEYPRISRAERVSIFVPSNDGFDEKFRKTRVTYRKVAIPFLYGYFAPGGSAGAPMPGLGIHTTTAEADPYVVSEIFSDVLKLDIAMPESAGGQRELLRTAIADTTRAAGDAGLQLATGVLHNIEAGGPQAGDLALVGTIIADPRIKLPHDLTAIVVKFGGDAVAFAAPLLDRILIAPLPDDKAAVYAASNAASILPPDAFSGENERSKLETIILDPHRSRMAYMALARLADSGAVVVPQLRERLRRGRDPRGALMALCRLGSLAKAAEPEVNSILLNGPRSEASLAARTIARLAGSSDVAPSEHKATDNVSGVCGP